MALNIDISANLTLNTEVTGFYANSVLDLQFDNDRYRVNNIKVSSTDFQANNFTRASDHLKKNPSTTYYDTFANNAMARHSDGIEVESGSTNLLTFENDFSNAAWVKTNTSITSANGLSPFGDLTASRCEFTSTSNSYLQQNVGSSITTAASAIWMKTNDGQANTTVTLYNSGVTSNAAVTNVWTRFETINSSPGTLDFRIGKRDAWGTAGAADILIAYASTEDNKFITSPIGGTRAPDVVTISSNGLIPSQGALAVVFTPNFDANTINIDNPIFYIGDGSTNYIQAYYNTVNKAQFQISSNSVLEVDSSSTDNVASIKNVLIISWEANNAQMMLNGTAITPDTSVTIPDALGDLQLWSVGLGTIYGNHLFERIIGWSTSKTANEIASIHSTLSS